MAGKVNKFYSVYDRHTDMPVIIHASGKECAEAAGISWQSLMSYASRTRTGKNRGKYDVFVDDPDEEREEEL